MLDKGLPILPSNHFWYFVKESFKVLDCSIVFHNVFYNKDVETC